MVRVFILQIVQILCIVSTIIAGRLVVPENPRNITKQQTDDDFMNICSKSNVFENSSVNLSGKVSVVTKLPSTPFVLRQATMLNRLETRFHSAGFKNIQFIIINYGAGGSANQINSTVINNITIINGENDHRFAQFDLHSAYIYDHCERLAYIIYGPWSSIQRPYVKASILSTIYDAPCGECDVRDHLEVLYFYKFFNFNRFHIWNHPILTYQQFTVPQPKIVYLRHKMPQRKKMILNRRQSI